MSLNPKKCSRCGGPPDHVITSHFAICNRCANTLGIHMNRAALEDERLMKKMRKEEPDEKQDRGRPKG